MSAAEKWDDDAFIQLMSEAISTPDEGNEGLVDLSAERLNLEINWDEFAGNFQ